MGDFCVGNFAGNLGRSLEYHGEGFHNGSYTQLQRNAGTINVALMWFNVVS